MEEKPSKGLQREDMEFLPTKFSPSSFFKRVSGITIAGIRQRFGAACSSTPMGFLLFPFLSHYLDDVTVDSLPLLFRRDHCFSYDVGVGGHQFAPKSWPSKGTGGTWCVQRNPHCCSSRKCSFPLSRSCADKPQNSRDLKRLGSENNPFSVWAFDLFSNIRDHSFRPYCRSKAFATNVWLPPSSLFAQLGFHRFRGHKSFSTLL